MTTTQVLLTIFVIAAATFLTRALPFLLFPAGRRTPGYVAYLGNALPCATIGMLIVYCVKGVSPSQWPHGLPELVSIAAVALVQLYRRNTLISIVVGTVLYMILIQKVFL